MRRLSILLLAALPMMGQTMVEYGLGTAAAGTAGGAAGSGGIGGIFSSLTKTLNSSLDQGGHAASTTPAKTTTAKVKPASTQPGVAADTATQAPSAPPKPSIVYEDPAGIKTGMERSELLSRFGEPVMKVTAGADNEALTYDAKDRVFEVEVRAGKVYSVQMKSKPRQASVVLLQ